MLIASYIATLMVIAMIASFNLVKKRYLSFALKNLKLALLFLAILAPLQIIIGDVVGLKIRHYQPIKTAAIEGLWETKKGAPFVLFAHISQQERKNTYSIEIPKLASFINTHHFNGELKGLDAVPQNELPRVAVVFYSFRVMVGMGLLIMMLTFLGLYYLRNNSLTSKNWYHRAVIVSAPSGFIALLTGWFTSEVGRQPWVVYGLVKTRDIVSTVTQQQVLNGFIVIIVTYGLIFGVGYLSFFFKMIKKGPVMKPRKRPNYPNLRGNHYE
jgi:cytochrome d ubiquinol oxidase subunit I